VGTTGALPDRHSDPRILPTFRNTLQRPRFSGKHLLPCPEYPDRVLRDAHLTFRIEYLEYRTVTGFARKTAAKIAKLAAFYWGPFWPAVLVLLPSLSCDRRLRVPLVALACCLAGILLTVGFQVHYAAPCTAVFALLLVETLRAIQANWTRLGSALLIAAPIGWLAVQALTSQAPSTPNSQDHRPRIEAQLMACPGRHLVFVHYQPLHPLHEEWVYNKPDIDGSRIIWARDLGIRPNQELIRYYPGRKSWILEPDQPHPSVVACSESCSRDAGAVDLVQ
jgi:hypothetical protein